MGTVRDGRKWLLLTTVLVAAIAGCSPVERHKVLTFFFTGVPPLEGEPSKETGKPVQEQTATTGQSRAKRIAVEKAAILKKRKITFLKAVRWMHGPYAAGECNRCHALAASLVLGGRGRGAKASSLDTSFGARLLAPAQELCVGCHETKSTHTATERGLRLHGPVAAGLCIACHSPHQSPRRFMLLKKNTVELCTQCHDKVGLQERTAAHRSAPDADCLTCHNPHMGRTAMILKAEYDEEGRP